MHKFKLISLLLFIFNVNTLLAQRGIVVINGGVEQKFVKSSALATNPPVSGYVLRTDGTNNFWSFSGSSGGVWGSITGKLKNQTDLSNVLGAISNKADQGVAAYGWGNHATNGYVNISDVYEKTNSFGYQSEILYRWRYPEYINVAQFAPMKNKKVFVFGFTAAGGNYYGRVLDYSSPTGIRVVASGFLGTSRHAQKVYGNEKLSTVYLAGNGGALDAITYSGTNLVRVQYTLPTPSDSYGIRGDGGNRLFVTDFDSLYLYEIGANETNLTLRDSKSDSGVACDAVWNADDSIVYQVDYNGKIITYRVSGFTLTKVGEITAPAGSYHGVYVNHNGKKTLVVENYYDNKMHIYNIDNPTNPIAIITNLILDDDRRFSEYNTISSYGCNILLGFDYTVDWRKYALLDISDRTKPYIAAYAREGMFYNPLIVGNYLIGYGKDNTDQYVLYITRNNLDVLCNTVTNNSRYNSLRISTVNTNDNRSVPNIAWLNTQGYVKGETDPKWSAASNSIMTKLARTNSWAFLERIPTNTAPYNLYISGVFPQGAQLRAIKSQTQVGTVRFLVATQAWNASMTSYGVIRHGFTATATASNAPQITTVAKNSRLVVVATNIITPTNWWVNIEYVVP